MLYIIDILRSNDPDIYIQIKDSLENQEASIFKTNAEISKELALYESEALKYEGEKKLSEDTGDQLLKESDFIKLEKYEILKKLNENLKLELMHIKDKSNSNEKKNNHIRKDSLKEQLNECVRRNLLLSFFYIFLLIS